MISLWTLKWASRKSKTGDFFNKSVNWICNCRLSIWKSIYLLGKSRQTSHRTWLPCHGQWPASCNAWASFHFISCLSFWDRNSKNECISHGKYRKHHLRSRHTQNTRNYSKTAKLMPQLEKAANAQKHFMCLGPIENSKSHFSYLLPPM